MTGEDERPKNVQLCLLTNGKLAVVRSGHVAEQAKESVDKIVSKRAKFLDGIITKRAKFLDGVYFKRAKFLDQGMMKRAKFLDGVYMKRAKYYDDPAMLFRTGSVRPSHPTIRLRLRAPALYHKWLPSSKRQQVEPGLSMIQGNGQIIKCVNLDSQQQK